MKNHSVDSIPNKNIRVRLIGISMSKTMPCFENFQRMKYGFTLTEQQKREAVSLWWHLYEPGLHYVYNKVVGIHEQTQ